MSPKVEVVLSDLDADRDEWVWEEYIGVAKEGRRESSKKVFILVTTIITDMGGYTNLRGFFVWGSILLVILSVGCTQIAIKEKKPDIRVTETNFKSGLSLAEGVIATGTYTLTNYGDAGGYATVAFIGDYSGTITQETVLVPAQNSIRKNVHLDTDSQDKSLRAVILKQTKAQ